MHIYLKKLGLGIATLGLVLFMGASCTKPATQTNNNTPESPVAVGQNNPSSGTGNNQNPAEQNNSARVRFEVLPAPTGDAETAPGAAAVKEFIMTSFYEMVDGQAKPQYSLKELVVKKGDKVRIKVTNIKGTHDFNIDEYNIHQSTPLDQQVTIEFTADKAGEFVYYCSMPNHRALGHWGTLKVE
ncbi:MAG: hypothetical protein C3F02_03295 [Parcubacteria group bacterium]|nr:MAG: hypothetical protein C3F02_03295 [Parcubacteria group bacterium]